MKRRIFLTSTIFASLCGSLAIAANKIYRYRCPKCKLIQEYGSIGTKKCPNDDKTMIRIN
jgi:hypothetical protein